MCNYTNHKPECQCKLWSGDRNLPGYVIENVTKQTIDSIRQELEAVIAVLEDDPHIPMRWVIQHMQHMIRRLK